MPLPSSLLRMAEFSGDRSAALQNFFAPLGKLA
jgi:hypothetical protein